MKLKVLNFLLIVTSLFGYLEWGGGQRSFLFQAEYEVLSKLFTDPESAAHPFTLIPLAGQVCLLMTLFQRKPRRLLTYSGIACLGLLLGFMMVIGLLSLHMGILASTIPFGVVAVLAVREQRGVATQTL